MNKADRPAEESQTPHHQGFKWLCFQEPDTDKKWYRPLTADGRKVISTMTQVAPNKMKHEMKGTDGGKDSVCVREFFADKLIAVCHCEGVETTRVYHAVP